MNFNDDTIHEFTIKNQDDTLDDIRRIVESFYDLGQVVEIKQITIGETNFSYYIMLRKDGINAKYFAQLFNSGKSLSDVKHELALRQYFMTHSKTSLKCALHYPTKDGSYTVACDCPEIGHTRYFCLFDFLEGQPLGDRETWAFGRMTKKMHSAYVTGIAYYHMGAYGFESPIKYEASSMMEFSKELETYRRIFTEEFEKHRGCDSRLAETYRYFGEYQPRLLELLEKYSERYLAEKDGLTICVAHMDPGANNYMFDSDLKPIGVCDLDWSQEHLRLFDITWAILESFCEYDPDQVVTNIDLDKCVDFINAYDRAFEENGNPMPGSLTAKEREMLPEIFQLVSMRFGFYNPWLLILTDNPTACDEYNIYWGNWGKTAIEFVETHMGEFKSKLCSRKEMRG